jgi:transposase
VPKVQPFPKEFRDRAVELVRSTPDRPLSQIARELGVSETGLRNWVNQAQVDVGERDRLTNGDRPPRFLSRRGWSAEPPAGEH